MEMDDDKLKEITASLQQASSNVIMIDHPISSAMDFIEVSELAKNVTKGVPVSISIKYIIQIQADPSDANRTIIWDTLSSVRGPMVILEEYEVFRARMHVKVLRAN